MKVAIASNGKDENSEVSDSGGRAQYYLIFENRNMIKVIKNPFRIGGGGAGFGVAEMLSEEGVEIVISGKLGHNMANALESKGIKHKETPNITVKEALERNR